MTRCKYGCGPFIAMSSAEPDTVAQRCDNCGTVYMYRVVERGPGFTKLQLIRTLA